MMIVTFKYVGVAMRADNKGEGGSFALLSLIARNLEAKKSWTSTLVILGVLATCLFYGDAMITPAISVLSAVEGLTIVQGQLQPLVVPISIAILIGLFVVQSRGTAKVGSVFGPVMIAYFAVLAILGLSNIMHHPGIVAIVNPAWAVGFFLYNPKLAFLALGSVVLCVTGAEALYADMGHFGRKAINLSWLTLVYPCLILNYMGQGALLLSNPHAAINPFYLLAPDWARLPLVFLATVATIIASQAVISGAFSITHQAIQLGFLPRLRTEHTSEKALGQIYIPIVNWALLVMVIVLVLGFRASSNLASAYGIAVTGTMLITSIMLGVLMLYVWKLESLARRRPRRAVRTRRWHLFRVEPDEDPGRRLVSVIDRRHQLHGLDDLGQGPRSDARAASGIGAAACRLRQVDRRLGPPSPRHLGLPFDLSRRRSRRASPQSEAQPGAP